MIQRLIDLLKTFPEYIPAVWAAGAILVLAVPFYFALWYFFWRRRLGFRWTVQLSFLTVFVLSAGLAFVLASPLAHVIHPALVQLYLFITSLCALQMIISLINIFLIEYYLIAYSRVYVSPPVRKVVQLCLYALGLLVVVLAVFHFNPLTLVAIPTILTAGVALALQDTLKAFIAGIGLGQIVRIGEWISFGGQEGRVVDINWARTVLQTIDGNYVYIPNSQLQTGMFVNFHSPDPTQRMSLRMSLSYDTPPARGKQVLLEAVQGVSGLAPEPPTEVQLTQFGDSGVEYAVYYWVRAYADRLQVQDAIATRIWYALERAKIEIPYPTRSLWIRHAPSKVDEAPAPSEKVLTALTQWELAQAFAPEDLRELARWVRPRVFSRGDVIVKQGDEGRSMFLILEGIVEVLREHEGTATVLAVLAKGQVFGEISLLTGAPRTMTVRAGDTAEVLELEKEGLAKILSKRPALSDTLARLVSQRQEALAGQAQGEASAGHASAPSAAPLAHRIREFLGLD